MNLFVKRGLTVAAIGALAFGMSACGALQDAADSGGSGDDSTESAALGCSDVDATVNEHAPNDTAALSEFEDAEFEKMTKWLVDNSSDFEDKELGSALNDWGTLASDYFAEEGNTLNEEDTAAFEKSGETIASACSELDYFQLEDEQ